MQRITFTREAIVDAAYQLTRELGWGAVTSRSIATRLGSSTMPIYSTTRSMREIEREVWKRAEGRLLDYQRRPVTGDIALDKAVGYVAFARDEKNLFRLLYLDRPHPAPAARGSDSAGSHGGPAENEAAGVTRSGGVESQPSLEELTTTEALPSLEAQTQTAMQDRRILKSWIFTHGLASLIAGGVISMSDEEIRSLLLEAGAAFVSF